MCVCFPYLKLIVSAPKVLVEPFYGDDRLFLCGHFVLPVVPRRVERLRWGVDYRIVIGPSIPHRNIIFGAQALTCAVPVRNVIDMDLRSYLNSIPPAEQSLFAARAGTTIGYLRKALSVKSEFGAELAVAIELESGGAVTRKDLYPEKWHRIWPELANRGAA